MAMMELTERDVAQVSGGLRVSDLPPSTNVRDLGWSPPGTSGPLIGRYVFANGRVVWFN